MNQAHYLHAVTDATVSDQEFEEAADFILGHRDNMAMAIIVSWIGRDGEKTCLKMKFCFDVLVKRKCGTMISQP